MQFNQKKNNADKTISEKPKANPMFRQKYGPWALITGASSCIGAEFARLALFYKLFARTYGSLYAFVRDASLKLVY